MRSRSASEVQRFQKRLYANYKNDLSLPLTYDYVYGNPVQPVVPLDTTQGGVCIIGAYPSAKFASIGSERDVPVADISFPFSTERYFNGTRTRTVASGEELEEAYLKPLGIHRDECWVTNLVRVFLFKDGHLVKYRRLGCKWPERETRKFFEKFAEQGMNWLEEELVLAQPKLVITLGAEVAGILKKVKGKRNRNALIDGDVKELKLGSEIYPIIHLAHPGIVMRAASERNPWPRLHRDVHIPAARKAIQSLLPVT